MSAKEERGEGCAAVQLGLQLVGSGRGSCAGLRGGKGKEWAEGVLGLGRFGHQAESRWLSLSFFSFRFLFYFSKHFQIEIEFKFGNQTKPHRTKQNYGQHECKDMLLNL